VRLADCCQRNRLGGRLTAITAVSLPIQSATEHVDGWAADCCQRNQLGGLKIWLSVEDRPQDDQLAHPKN